MLMIFVILLCKSNFPCVNVTFQGFGSWNTIFYLITRNNMQYIVIYMNHPRRNSSFFTHFLYEVVKLYTFGNTNVRKYTNNHFVKESAHVITCCSGKNFNFEAMLGLLRFSYFTYTASRVVRRTEAARTIVQINLT